MKLRKIYVENFGKLSGFTMDLTDGLNCIEQENGWGKSTLANFIRVMFFGFENEGKRKGASERERFRPWNGSTYGGFMEFEVKGKSYRLVRKFGIKENTDEFHLIDLETMLESNDFSSDIGHEIFGIDSSGFLHTLFIGQDDMDSTATDDVKAKLSDLSGLSDDMAAYDSVISKLRDKANSIGGTGQKAEMKVSGTAIITLESKLKSQESVDRAIDDTDALLQEKKAELADGKRRLAELNAEQAAVSGMEGLKAKRENYDALVRSFEDRRKQRDAAAAQFCGNVPEEGELLSKNQAAAQLRVKEMNLERYRLSEEESAFLEKYAPVYASGIPDPDSIERVDGLIRERAIKEKQFAALQFSEEEKADFEIYSAKFAGKGDVGAEAEQAITSLIEICSLEKNIGSKEDRLQSMMDEANEKPAPASRGVRITLIAIGIVLLVLGIPAFAASPAAGAGLVVIGILLLTVGLRLGKYSAAKEEKDAWEAAVEALEKELGSDREYVYSGRKKIREMVLSMDLPAANDNLMSSLIKLKGAYDRYCSLLAKEQDQRDDRLAEEISLLNREIRNFLVPYSEIFVGVHDDADKLDVIGRNVENYTKCRDKKAAFESLKSQILIEKEPLAAYARSVGSYDEKKDISSRFADINEAFIRHQNADAEFKGADYALSCFRRDNDMKKILEADPAVDCRPLDRINSDISKLNDELESVQNLIRDYSADLEGLLLQKDELAEAAEKLDAEREKFEEQKHRYRLVQKTKELLEAAHTSLTNRYKQPVEDGFRKYYSLLDGGDSSDFIVNANMELAVDEQGTPRSPGLYSSGTRDKINLCMRMGLIDAMYRDDKPFIIMDDPFTNLDNTRLAGGLEMVRTLAEDRQIIYMTCHGSRAV